MLLIPLDGTVLALEGILSMQINNVKLYMYLESFGE